MGLWIDTPTWHPVATLKARGVEGVMRYLCEPYNTGPGSSMPNKRLERAELDQKIAAGIDVGVNWEDAANDATFGYPRGLDKGKKAGSWMLDVLDWPAGGSCCSSIDFDVPHWIGSAPQDYQRGFAEGLTQNGPYVPGIYGDTQALDGANADGTAHVFWWSTAKGWSGGVRPKMVHLDQNGYWQWDDSADLNTVVTSPFGSYMQASRGEEEDMTPEQVKLLTDLHNWFKGAKIPPGQANLGSTLAATLPVTQANHNKLNGITTMLAAVPTEKQMAVALAKIPGNVRLTPEQIALLIAALEEDTQPPPAA
jgi:hypothetical protein